MVVMAAASCMLIVEISQVLRCGMVEVKNDGEADSGRGSGKWTVPTGRRTDEWSECLVLIGKSNDRASFTRFFRHFAPLIKALSLIHI